MNALRGLALLLLLQMAGEGLARLLRLPVPGPVLGLLLLLLLLRWPAPRVAVGAAAEVLLAHLSLLFVPVGVGVITQLDVALQHGAALVAAIVVSTWVGMAVTAWLLRRLLVRADVESEPHP